MRDGANDLDIRTMDDMQLLEHITGLDEVTPLENELVRRLEIYVEVYGDFGGTGD